MGPRWLLHGPAAAGSGGGARRVQGGDSRVNAPQALQLAMVGRRLAMDGFGCEGQRTGAMGEGRWGAGVEQRCPDHTQARRVGKSASV